jgi:hypothetical protein
LLFQLTSGPQGPKKKRLFEGIADVGIAVHQNGHMPWLRAVSGLLSTLPNGSLRENKKATEDLPIRVPSEDCSIKISIDFVDPNHGNLQESLTSWTVGWHAVCIRLQLSMCYPQVSTLSWFHLY